MFIVIRTPTWQSHTERIWNSWCHWQSTILKKIVIWKLQSDLDIWIIHSNIQFGKFWKRKLIPKFYWWLHLYLWCVARFGKPATSLKVTFLHGCFSLFLNCTNDTISRKASHIYGILQAIRDIVHEACLSHFLRSIVKMKSNLVLHESAVYFSLPMFFWKIQIILTLNIRITRMEDYGKSLKMSHY